MQLHYLGKLISVGLWDDFAERVVGRIEHSQSKGHLTEKSLMSNMYSSKRFFFKWSHYFLGYFDWYFHKVFNTFTSFVITI